jgi:hypothetical protein
MWEKIPVETFIESRDFVDNPRYLQDRQEVLAAFDLSEIDEPISEIINGFTGVSHCFPLQSCYGHFLYSKEQNSHNLNPLPSQDCGRVRYRIAYVAFCIEHSTPGRSFRDELANIPMIAPDYIQFGSADWFWKRHPNSYAVQVEPKRYMEKDEVMLEYDEALRVQDCRDLFFIELKKLLSRQKLENTKHGMGKLSGIM